MNKSTHTRRKTKNDIQSLPYPQSSIQDSRFKGPENPPMPNNDAVFNVQPLRVLVSVVNSLVKANDTDYNFTMGMTQQLQENQDKNSSQRVTLYFTHKYESFRTRHHINHHAYC